MGVIFKGQNVEGQSGVRAKVMAGLVGGEELLHAELEAADNVPVGKSETTDRPGQSRQTYNKNEKGTKNVKNDKNKNTTRTEKKR